MTNLLLDTNVFLWYFWGSERIDTVKQLIESNKDDVFISSVSWWEIAIKVRTGKLTVDLEQLRFHAEKHDFFELPITGNYFKAYKVSPSQKTSHKGTETRRIQGKKIYHGDTQSFTEEEFYHEQARTNTNLVNSSLHNS